MRCVIFTSGTLSPLSALVSEFGIPIPVSLENPHVIGLDQVTVSILTKGADGFELNSSFRTRYVNIFACYILYVFCSEI